MSLFDQFVAFDDKLASTGQPACSPFWRGELQRFLDAYEAGTSFEWWGCVGRGGAKSTTIYKLALFFLLFGAFEIPPHETHYAVVISRNKIEASKGLVIVSRWLQALGIKADSKGEVIELPDLRRGVRVLSCSVSAASGWRAFAVFADEQAKWSRDGEQMLMDADEVLSSAKATTATHAKAPIVVMSTPWMREGSFFDTVTANEDPAVIVTPPTPSWIANPAIDEASTHRKERSHRTWEREYLCVFTSGFEEGFFPPASIEAAMTLDTGGKPSPDGSYAVAIDPAFTGDNWATVVAALRVHARSRRDPRRRRLRVC